MSDPSYRGRTRVIHAGLPDAEKSAPCLPGPTFAAPFHLSGDPYEAEFVYGRYGNPTWTHYEQALGSSRAATAVLFASGMAAVSAVFLAAPATRRRAGGPRRLLPRYARARGSASGGAGDRGAAGSRPPDPTAPTPARAPVSSAREPVEPGPRVGDLGAFARAARHAAGHWRRQHVRHAARTAAARPGRGPLDGERLEAAHRPRRPAHGLRGGARPGGRRGAR